MCKKINMTKIEKYRVQKWIDALRSGEYKQGFGSLKNNAGNFCVLGVLCDVHRKTLKRSGYNWKGNSYLGWHGLLPNEVARWVGLFDIVENLVDYNDIHKYSFKKIASILQKRIA